MRNNTLIVVPTYNEADNVTYLIRKIFALRAQLSVLVIDDCSPDKTYVKVEALKEKYPRLHLIVRNSKQGLGSAYIEGFRYALNRQFEYVIQMDADLSHSPGQILPMLKRSSGCDLVVGSRYVSEGGVSGWPLTRVLLSRSANIFAKILLRVPLNDSTSGFKCVKRQVLEAIDFSTIPSKGYAFQIEMVYRAFLNGFRVLEYPIVFYGRRKERSKMSLGIIVEALFRVVYLAVSRSISGKTPKVSTVNKITAYS